jgi:hypothetical protein
VVVVGRYPSAWIVLRVGAIVARPKHSTKDLGSEADLDIRTIAGSLL